MRRVMLILLIVYFFSGCATSSKKIMSDGKEGYIINCSGILLSWSKCYEDAGNLCGSKGYEVLDKSDEAGSKLNAGQYNFDDITMDKLMIIKCRE